MVLDFVKLSYLLPLLVFTLICRPRLWCGFITQRLLVAVMSNSSQPSSIAHNWRDSNRKRSASLHRKQIYRYNLSIELQLREWFSHSSTYIFIYLFILTILEPWPDITAKGQCHLFHYFLSIYNNILKGSIQLLKHKRMSAFNQLTIILEAYV